MRVVWSLRTLLCVQLFPNHVNPLRVCQVEGLVPPPLTETHPERYSGGYSDGVPPLPIPNREVKPARADGTARPVGE